MHFLSVKMAHCVVAALQMSRLISAFPHPATNSLQERSFSAGETETDPDNVSDEEWGISPDKRSINPLSKRALFDTSRITDQGRRNQLDQALRDAVEIARVTIDNMNAPEHQAKLNQWFGPNANAAEVRGRFENIAGPTNNPQPDGTAILGTIIVYPDDYWRLNAQQDPQQRLACDRVSAQGTTMVAYYKRRNGAPGMHFCPKFFQRENLQTYVSNCATLGDRITTDMTSRRFQGQNVIHELMHVPDVGGGRPNRPTIPIVDDQPNAYNAFRALQYAGGANSVPNLNADSYAFFSTHIFLEVTCGRTFQFPNSDADN